MFGGIESILDWSHQTASVILTRDASHTALAGGEGDGVEQASSFITLHVQAQVCYFLQLSKYEAHTRWQGFIETNVNTSKSGQKSMASKANISTNIVQSKKMHCNMQGTIDPSF